MLALAPGDPFGELATNPAIPPEVRAALRFKFGLDDPIPVRYLHWLEGMVGGDPGVSLVNGMPIAELVGQRLANSLRLALLTTIVTVPLALLVGITAAVWRGSPYDRVVNVLTVATVSVPEFLFATLAVLVFAVTLHWLPALSYGINADTWSAMLRSYALPLISAQIADGAADAVTVAAELGGPVALKAIGEGLLHKTDAGGVRLGLADPEAVRAAAEEIEAAVTAAGHRVDGLLVQQMAPAGVELIVGVVNDHYFGPVLACGAGGVTAELGNDVAAVKDLIAHAEGRSDCLAATEGYGQAIKRLSPNGIGAPSTAPCNWLK